MLSGRMLQVLEYLVEHHKTSYKEISSDLEINERNVRYDIEKINDYLYLCHLPLVEKYSKGIVLCPDNIDLSIFRNQEHFFYSAKERVSLIILILLFDAPHLKINKLCDDFQVSRSTIKNDMSDLELELVELNLTIKFDQHFEIIGDHRSVMNLMAYEVSKYLYLLKNKDINMNSFETYAYNLIIEYFNQVPIDDILGWGDRILENCMGINDEGYNFCITNVLLLCYYIIHDKELPKNIGFDATESPEKYSVEILIFEDMIHHVVTHFYKGTLIRLLEYFDNYEGLSNHLDANDIQKLISQLVNLMSNKLSVDFSNDRLLLESLLHHVTPLLKRVFTERYMYHNLKVVIPKQDHYVYEALEEVLQEIDLFKSLGSDEKTYLAVHFIVSLNRMKKASYKRIVIVCNYGYGSSTMLKETLVSEFQVIVVDIIPYYKLSTFDYREDIDYIISTLPLKDNYQSKNIVVNPLFTQQDYIKLEEAGIEKKKININYSALSSKLSFLDEDDKSKVLSLLQNELGNQETKIPKRVYKVSDLLRENCIRIYDEELNWEDAVLISSRLLEREKDVEVGYGRKIIEVIKKIGFYCVTDELFALFHGQSDENIHSSAISLLVNKKAMYFDDKSVKVVFCLASKDKKDQIPAMILLMRMIKKTNFLSRIEMAKSPHEVYEILKESEEEVLY